MSRAHPVVLEARSHLGRKEEGGPNRGSIVQESNLDEGLPWCAGFVMLCFFEGGMPLHSSAGERWRWRSVKALEEGLRALGWWWDARLPFDPEPGDVIFYRGREASDPGRGRHVGIVEGCERGAIVSIEGNLGDSVKRATHRRDDPRIAGFARRPHPMRSR